MFNTLVRIGVFVILFAIPWFVLLEIWERTTFCPFPVLFHDYLHLHKPDTHKPSFLVHTKDGDYVLAYCKICGKKILQDYTGNWITTRRFE